MIDVRKIDDTTFEVTVDDNPPTTHEVSLDPSYLERLTDGRVEPERLISESFEFLLERESNTEILPRFDLPVINRYFPEYEEEIKSRLL
ncbi:MAG: hypothetical protein ACOCV2_04685 [Persicimonas sp.]